MDTAQSRPRHRYFPAVLSLIFGALCAAATPLLAGQFTITPVRMYLTPQDRAIAVTITNEGDTPLVMQADVYTWKQKPGGEDDLALTEDLILSPPIIKLAARAKQVVRLARVRNVPSPSQTTYRLIVREIPEALPAGQNLQLQIALAFSMPVFITPPTAKRQLGCTVERGAPNTVRAVCENTGNAYAQIAEMALVSDSGEKLAARETGGYILPGINRAFDITRKDARIPGGKGKLTVTLDDTSTQSYDVIIPE
jgi:fimbrial chaperone protein